MRIAQPDKMCMVSVRTSAVTTPTHLLNQASGTRGTWGWLLCVGRGIWVCMISAIADVCRLVKSNTSMDASLPFVTPASLIGILVNAPMPSRA